MDYFKVKDGLYTVSAYRLEQDKIFFLTNETIRGHKGDWVIQTQGGSILLTDKQFQLFFEPIE